MGQFASAVPGRLRVKDPRFGDVSAANDYLTRLQQAMGGDKRLTTRINPAATSVIVHFDARRTPLIDVQRAASELLESRAAPDTQRHKSSGKRRSRRMRINRYAKIGALASLAASMAFAAAGGKRLHVITGMLFLACLSAHLAVFRRTLTH